MGKEICGNHKTQHFALVDIYLLLDAREGKGAVVMFNELWGFHLPGLSACLNAAAFSKHSVP